MRVRLAVAIVIGIVSLLPTLPADAFFQVFSQLAEEMKSIEQSAPDDQEKTIRELRTAAFTDVSENDWFFRYVTPVARWGIVAGYKDAKGKPTGAFGPGNTVTIAETLKMALKAAQVDETTCKGTPSLAQARDHWARAFVVCAEGKKMRLFASKPDLNRAATRAEVLSVIFDAFGDKVPPLFSSFTDTAEHPLESDIAYAAALKIVSGDKDGSGRSTGTFRPDAAVLRGEAAKMMYERLRVEVMGKKK